MRESVLKTFKSVLNDFNWFRCELKRPRGGRVDILRGARRELSECTAFRRRVWKESRDNPAGAQAGRKYRVQQSDPRPDSRPL